MTTTEKNFAEELEELLSDNSNYKSSYTGTPVFFSEIAIPKIIALMKAKKFSFNPVLSDSLPSVHQCRYSKSMHQEYPRKCVDCGKREEGNV